MIKEGAPAFLKTRLLNTSLSEVPRELPGSATYEIFLNRTS